MLADGARRSFGQRVSRPPNKLGRWFAAVLTLMQVAENELVPVKTFSSVNPALALGGGCVFCLLLICWSVLGVVAHVD